MLPVHLSTWISSIPMPLSGTSNYRRGNQKVRFGVITLLGVKTKSGTQFSEPNIYEDLSNFFSIPLTRNRSKNPLLFRLHAVLKKRWPVGMSSSLLRHRT